MIYTWLALIHICFTIGFTAAILTLFRARPYRKLHVWLLGISYCGLSFVLATQVGQAEWWQLIVLFVLYLLGDVGLACLFVVKIREIVEKKG